MITRDYRCSFWNYDDVSKCFRDNYLEYLIPLLLGLTSAFIIALDVLLRGAGRIKLEEDSKEETRPLVAQADVYGSISLPENEEVSLAERHFDLARVPDTNDDDTPRGYIEEVNRSTSDLLKSSMEFVAIVLEIGLSLSSFVVKDLNNEWPQLRIRLLRSLFWIYIFVLKTVRIRYSDFSASLCPSLSSHCTMLYTFSLFISSVTFRSAIIHRDENKAVSSYFIIDFILVALLFLVSFTTKVGDVPAEIYVPSDGTKPSSETTSSLLSFITYSWIDKMVWKASSSAEFKVGDVWALITEDYALSVLKSFQAAKSAAGFSFRLFWFFKYLFLIQALWAVVDSIIIFAPSVLLKKVLEYVEDQNSIPTNVAWALIILMPVSKLVESLTSGASLFLGRRVCVRMKAILIGEIYGKALRRRITVLSKNDGEDEKQEGEDPSEESSAEEKPEESKTTAELGAIINLMSIDTFKVAEICGYLHYFTQALLMIIFSLVLLYQLLGWSALVGSLVVLLVFPINYKTSAWLGNAQKEMLQVTDKRIQMLNETFQSIRIIKFFAWEDNFFEKVMKIRREELSKLRKRALIWCFGSFIWFCTPTLLSFFSFYCYSVIEGKPLTAPIAFTALSLFALLKSPLDQLSGMTAFVIQSKVSLDRISEFLDEKETDKYEQLNKKKSPNSPNVGFEHATFSWGSSSKTDFKLRDIDVKFKEGALNIIIGPIGAGKTSLLLALLGEMELVEGNVYLPGYIPREELVIDPRTGLTESVAYCSQSSWLLNDSIRNNITFGSPFNQSRYDAVVEACSLKRDFLILSGGDATEIGEKGITLSGGQKQRVSLARALYSNSKYVLLDDCLSAVDAHTALWIYENCISGALMKGRTCILVSHNVALTVQNAEWVVLLENGRVKSQGSPEKLLKEGLLGDDELVLSSIMASRTQSSTNLKTAEDKTSEMKLKAEAIDAKLKQLVGEEEEVIKRTDGKLVDEEAKAEGFVGWDVYTSYGKLYGGFFIWVSILLFYCFSHSIDILQSWWLKYWSSHAAKAITMTFFRTGLTHATSEAILSPIVRGISRVGEATGEIQQTFSTMKEEHGPLYYISIYALIGVLYSTFASLRVYVTFEAGVRASNRIFKRVLLAVLGAKLRFFDKTPQGRIMNRFSKDIEAVDQELPPFGEGVFICIVECLATLILIAVITPGFLFFAVVISYLYYLVGKYYLNLSRELKRFESITKSPIHQHFSETLNGVSTIRAYGVEKRFMKFNLKAIDKNNEPFFYLWVANRWLSLRVDIVGALVMFFAAVFVMLSVGKIDAGLAGLSLTYAISFSESALWIVRLYSNVEMNMNSVERLREYFSIEQEPPREIPENKPPSSWPEKGEIKVENVSLRYDPNLPRVIKDVSFTVEPKNKVGIVGRTGAGKSTIITAFFRFLDPETGHILIDGVDITKIGLQDLRQAITIIPQDPTLFSGTIRSNLDPFNQYTDEQIFESLRRVNLIAPGETESDNSASENQNKFLNLSSVVAESGNNLSQGQRQLMCLARSLLKNPRVILLDEATASIDYKSDSMIQQTIREEFSSSTILTIAHRLRSIIDYDKILVMDGGRVVEYDHPYVLITNKDSLFYSMCENSGEVDSLTKLAKEAFINNKNKKKNISN